MIASSAVRRELAEDLTHRAVAACVPMLGREDVPEHVRALSSPHVLAVEHDLINQIINGSKREKITVVEGAAGAGKTRRLAATRDQIEARGGRMVVVTPTRKAAQVASEAIGAEASPVAKLLHEHGYRWDADGRWTRTEPSPTAPRLDARTLLVVDEAGMLDQDSARALLALAGAGGSEVMLIGDRHQLPAVGRGGVLDLAARYADRHIELDGVHRFTDPDYAQLTMRMRTSQQTGEVFDELHRRGNIVLHASDVERQDVLAAKASFGGGLIVADTREQVTAINRVAHRIRVRHGEATNAVVTAAGEQIGIGDTIATRRNDADVGVANRETWTVIDHSPDGLLVKGEGGRRLLPPGYVNQYVELAYGAQGTTVPAAHVAVGEHTSASSAYVAMTRGRDSNIAHLVADNLDDARAQWIEVFGRNRADLGPRHARTLATEAIDRYGPAAPRRRPAPPLPTGRDPLSDPYRRPAATPARGLGL